MQRENVNRSPLFYVGDKYKLIGEIRSHFPRRIRQFVEPFVGGGSVFMNVEADKYLLNDLDPNVIGIHKYLCGQVGHEDEFYAKMFDVIDEYGLSCSYRRGDVPQELKEAFKKTYFARYNKENFNRLKSDYNRMHRGDMLYLYILLIYGFNRMLRFNSKGDYNLPVGNVDFNSNTYDALKSYFREVESKRPVWSNMDFRLFFDIVDLNGDDLVYLDPPYLITFSEYNKYWNEQTERDLLAILDALSDRGIRFAISNVTHYKGRENQIFIEWSRKYNTHPVKSNYISYHDNTVKRFNEVLITNY